MLIEHFIYNLSIAILVGIIYNHYYHRNPSWIIVVCAGILDIDYLVQSVCFGFYYSTGIYLPVMITHGNFHNIPIIIILALIFGYIIYKIFNENIYDSMICVAIAGLAHFVADVYVYTYTYYPLYPINGFLFKSAAILPEMRNMPFGIGDWTLLVIGLGILCYMCIVKFATDGVECLEYFSFHANKVYLICISIINHYP